MRAGARDAYIPFLHITQGDIHHCRHQGVVEGVVLGERRYAEILEHCREREIDDRIGRRVTILSLVVELGDLDARLGSSISMKGRIYLSSMAISKST